MIQFELSEGDFQMLVFLLGLGGGAASRDGKPGLVAKSMALANDLIRQKEGRSDDLPAREV